jgi:acetylornithine deacetylase/succinyl-diaminopimelate desuccinylase-like protein
MARASIKLLTALAGLSLSAAAANAAPTKVAPAWHDQTLAIWKKMIAIPSVHGRGQMRPLAESIARQLRDGGFAAEDIVIEGEGDDISLAARYRGTDKGKRKALLLSGHMDVVEARPSDWKRDPFTPIEEGGYLYGRGSYDMKLGNAVMVSTLIELKRSGFRPRRDILLLLSGDEETAMMTTRRLATRYAPEGYLLLNADSGGGMLDQASKPISYKLEAAEKTYADFEISLTDPGGHSSRPTASNAIYRLSRLIDRISTYQFPPQLSDITRAYFRETGKLVGGATGAALLRFAEDPTDAGAIATLRADPEYIGMIGTTCVATMLSGGHAYNALPQRAAVVINCRIFPGVPVEQIKAKLAEVVADPQALITTLDDPTSSDASPLDPSLLRAVRHGIDRSYPGLPIVPMMETGASDSLHFRALGVPSYGVAASFLRPEDDFAHGLDERLPLSTIEPGLLLWHSLITELSN